MKNRSHLDQKNNYSLVMYEEKTHKQTGEEKIRRMHMFQNISGINLKKLMSDIIRI